MGGFKCLGAFVKKIFVRFWIQYSIAAHKDQFVDFKIISGKVSGNTEEPLDVEGLSTESS